MKWTLQLLKTRQTRRLAAALAISGAGAAVAASVMWAEAIKGDPPLPASASAEFLSAAKAFGSSQSAALGAVAASERVSATPRSNRARVDPAGPVRARPSVLGDRSLPAAEEALRVVAPDAMEAAPTF